MKGLRKCQKGLLSRIAHRPSSSHAPALAPAAISAATHSGDGDAAASINAVAPRRSRVERRPEAAEGTAIVGAGPAIPGVAPSIPTAAPPILGVGRSS